MEDFRSKSCGHGGMQIERYHGGVGGDKSSGINGMRDLRCYSPYCASSATQAQTQMENDLKYFKKGKSRNGSAASKSWSFNDPELQRKKRVASYKVYAVEGKVKRSLRKSFRWVKDRCTMVVHGWV